MTQQHGLTLGDFDFVSEAATADGYSIEAVSEGTAFGAPEAIIETIRSLLTDGSLAVLEGWDNREITLRLRLSAPTAQAGPALAKAEADLFAYVLSDPKSPLVYTPPADGAAVTVFDVVVARLDRDYSNEWDFEESQHEYRYFILTLTCLPFARGEESVVVEAESGVNSTIDTCDAITGWSSVTESGATLTDFSDGGAYINVTGTATAAVGSSISAQRDTTISMGGLPYLKVTADIISGDPLSFSYIDSMGARVTAAVVAEDIGSVVGGVPDYLLAVPDTVRSLRVTQGDVGGGALNFRVYNLQATDSLPTASTARQLRRALEVRGSAPTTAALRVADSLAAALGTEILVHTSQNLSWRPDLRTDWRVSSAAVTADAAMVSGSRNTLTTPTTYEIPASMFTAGTYALMARMNVAVAGTLTWSARMVDSAGATTVGSSVTADGSVALAITSGYEVVSLGALVLPVVDVEGAQMVELTLTGTVNMTLDESWLFGLDDGALTWIKDADSLTWVEIRSPELDSARPSVFGGLLANRSDGTCIDWKCESFGTHRFAPGLMQVFTVTSSTLTSESEIEFYPRYHSHVYDESA